MRKELACFNLVCSCFNWLAKFPALLFINRCLQILNFGRALSHEDDQSNIRDPSHPGITNQLRIECQQTLRLFRIAIRRRFPVDDAFRSVQLADCVYVRKKLAPGWK